ASWKRSMRVFSSADSVVLKAVLRVDMSLSIVRFRAAVFARACIRARLRAQAALLRGLPSIDSPTEGLSRVGSAHPPDRSVSAPPMPGIRESRLQRYFEPARDHPNAYAAPGLRDKCSLVD